MRTAIAACLLALAACDGASAPEGAARDTVRVGAYRSLGLAPIILAQDRGYFTDEGLTIVLSELRGSEGRLAAALAGEIDVGAGVISMADFSSAARGVTLRSVADRGHLEPGECAFVGFVLRPGLDSSVAGPQIRRAVATPDGPGLFLLDRLLTATGGDWDQVERIRLPSPARPEAVIRGEVDLMEAESPHLDHAMTRATFWRNGADLRPGMQWAHVRFTDRLLTTDRDVGVRFLAAYRRGIAAYHEGKTARNVAVLARELLQDTMAVRAACWPAIRRDARLDVASMLEYQDWAVGRQLLEQAARPDQLLDTTLMHAVDSLLATRTAGASSTLDQP
jgi:NitT/TauT family transport system substrate-binding protein